MIARCARLLAWLDRAIDPFPGALELVVGLQKDLRSLRARVAEFRQALADFRDATARRRRPSRSRRNGRTYRRVSAQH